MRRALLVLVLLPALLPVATLAKGGPGFPTRPYANPGGVIGAEVGFNVVARDAGMVEATKESATEDAWLYAPEPVLVASWLKGRAEPAQRESWSPHAVWSSCDGSYAVTTGSWHATAQSGTFTTLWQRQEDGGYKWVLRQETTQAAPETEPDMIAATVAECPKRKDDDQTPGPPPSEKRGKPDKKDAPPFDPAKGQSDDGTLSWLMVQDETGQHVLTITIHKSGTDQAVLGAIPAA